MEKNEVLDASLLIEGQSGLTTVFSVIEYPPSIETCIALLPLKADYDKALDIAWKLRLRGKPIGTVDIIIASICINRNLKLITKDKDFEFIKEVEKGFEVKII